MVRQSLHLYNLSISSCVLLELHIRDRINRTIITEKGFSNPGNKLETERIEGKKDVG